MKCIIATIVAALFANTAAAEWQREVQNPWGAEVVIYRSGPPKDLFEIQCIGDTYPMLYVETEWAVWMDAATYLATPPERRRKFEIRPKGTTEWTGPEGIREEDGHLDFAYLDSKGQVELATAIMAAGGYDLRATEPNGDGREFSRDLPIDESLTQWFASCDGDAE